MDNLTRYFRDPVRSYKVTETQNVGICLENAFADYGTPNLPDTCKVQKQIGLQVDHNGHVSRQGNYGSVFVATEAGEEIILKLMKIDNEMPKIHQDAVFAEIFYQILHPRFFARCPNLVKALGLNMLFSHMDFDKCFTAGNAELPQPEAKRIFQYVVLKTKRLSCMLSAAMEFLHESEPKRQLSPDALRVLADAFLMAMETLHDNAVIHRDIKPDNIGLDEDGTPVMIDFGSATCDARNGKLQDQKGIGSSNWSSPALRAIEYGLIVDEAQKYGREVDYHSSGLILLNAATGESEIQWPDHGERTTKFLDELKATRGKKAKSARHFAQFMEILLGGAPMQTAAELRKSPWFGTAQQRAGWMRRGKAELAACVREALGSKNKAVQANEVIKKWNQSLPKHFHSPTVEEILNKRCDAKALKAAEKSPDIKQLRFLALLPASAFKATPEMLEIIRTRMPLDVQLQRHRDGDGERITHAQILGRLMKLRSEEANKEWLPLPRKPRRRKPGATRKPRDKEARREAARAERTRELNPLPEQHVGQGLGVFQIIDVDSDEDEGEKQHFIFVKKPSISPEVAELLGITTECYEEVLKMCRDAELQLARLPYSQVE